MKPQKKHTQQQHICSPIESCTTKMSLIKFARQMIKRWLKARRQWNWWEKACRKEWANKQSLEDELLYFQLCCNQYEKRIAEYRQQIYVLVQNEQQQREKWERAMREKNYAKDYDLFRDPEIHEAAHMQAIHVIYKEGSEVRCDTKELADHFKPNTN